MSLITNRVRKLRQNSTHAGLILWEQLRNRRIVFKFVREKPFTIQYENKLIHFIADFYCNECKLVIEVDGFIHENQKEYDECRSIFLQIHKNITVIRFANSEVENDLGTVVNKIRQACESTCPIHSPSPNPFGEGVGG